MPTFIGMVGLLADRRGDLRRRAERLTSDLRSAAIVRASPAVCPNWTPTPARSCAPATDSGAGQTGDQSGWRRERAAASPSAASAQAREVTGGFLRRFLFAHKKAPTHNGRKSPCAACVALWCCSAFLLIGEFFAQSRALVVLQHRVRNFSEAGGGAGARQRPRAYSGARSGAGT